MSEASFTLQLCKIKNGNMYMKLSSTTVKF